LKKNIRFFIIGFVFTVIPFICYANLAPSVPLIDIKAINPEILVYLVYSTPDNFTGKDLYGHISTCYLRKEAALKLDKAQQYLNRLNKGYDLLVYDGLRPRNVQYTMWDILKGTTKQKYVANPKTGSIHNYGVAVDLTITDENGMPIDMGTPFDFFGELAQPRYEAKFLKSGKLTPKQIKNRELLRDVMTHAGFKGISIEWWHFNAFSIGECRKRFRMVDKFPVKK